MSGAETWALAMASASRLGVSPEAFWRLSLWEWRALTAPFAAAAAPDRTALEALMRRYPDKDAGDGR